MTEAGEASLRAIVQAAEISNPSLYSCKKSNPFLQQLASTLPLLLELEVSLKQGAEDMSHL